VAGGCGGGRVAVVVRGFRPERLPVRAGPSSRCRRLSSASWWSGCAPRPWLARHQARLTHDAADQLERGRLALASQLGRHWE
jgi:hypothetical protein